MAAKQVRAKLHSLDKVHPQTHILPFPSQNGMSMTKLSLGQFLINAICLARVKTVPRSMLIIKQSTFDCKQVPLLLSGIDTALDVTARGQIGV